MIDIWLIFTLLLPFMEVLLHTYIDYLRNDEDREINHHGKSIKPETNDDDDAILITRVIPSPVQNIKPKDLVSRNEETQVKALRNHYENLDNKEKENIRKLNFCF